MKIVGKGIIDLFAYWVSTKYQKSEGYKLQTELETMSNRSKGYKLQTELETMSNKH